MKKMQDEFEDKLMVIWEPFCMLDDKDFKTDNPNNLLITQLIVAISLRIRSPLGSDLFKKIKHEEYRLSD